MLKYSEICVVQTKEISQGGKKTWCWDDFTATSEQPGDLTAWGRQVEPTTREQDLNGGMAQRKSTGLSGCLLSACIEHLQELP